MVKLKMKKTISFIAALTMVGLLGTVSASAALPPLPVGDVNHDGTIDVADATKVQHAAAGMHGQDCNFTLFADFNRDGTVDVTDATSIQQHAAGIALPEGCGGWIDPHVGVTSFHAVPMSASATVHTPVTFSAEGYECTYAFLIDGEEVQPRSETSSFTHTFDAAGTYSVSLLAYNGDGYCKEKTMRFTVVEPMPVDEVRITDFRVYENAQNRYTVTAQAQGGDAPYTYHLSLLPDTDFGDTGLTADGIAVFEEYAQTHETDWQLLYDRDGNAFLYREFSDADAVSIDLEMLSPLSSHEAQLWAEDANGAASKTKRVLLYDGYVG